MLVVFSARCVHYNALKKLSMVAFEEQELDGPVIETEVKSGKEKPVDLVELRRDVRKLMAWCQIIHQQNKAIKRRLTWMTINSYIRLILWLAPLILLAIYVPRWIQEFRDTANSIKSGQFITSSTIWNGAEASLDQLRAKFQ